MTRLLVTGFEPFGGDRYNPSGAAMSALAAMKAQGRWPDTAFGVLPVTWVGGRAVLKALCEAEEPTALLMFGLATTAHAMRLERRAFNRQGLGLVDNVGMSGDGGELLSGGQPEVATQIDLDALEASLLSQDVPVERSEDPGNFLCNAVYHQALTTEGACQESAAFIHVPATRQCGGTLDEKLVQRWIEKTVETYRLLTAAGRDR